MLCGIDESVFWNMTPREFERAQWVYFERLKRDVKASEDRVIKTAWWTVNLTRHKRLPSLHILLTPPKVLTPDEQAERQAEFDRLEREMGQ